MTRKIDVASIPSVRGTMYPPPFHTPCLERARQRLGDSVGLDQFGVNLLTLAPGAWSSQRHWHTREDEFVYVLSGEVILVTDSGEEVLRVGDCAGFKAGVADGHCLQNRTEQDAQVLEIGSRMEDDGAFYPDIDLVNPPRGEPAVYTNRSGMSYGELVRRTKDG
jgi:uncharacterized cupin superfamily protein